VSRLDRERRELRLKVVYAGPGLSGKTTNLRHLHAELPAEKRGQLVMLANDDERTLFFDFLPIEIPNVSGYRLRLGVYTIPGQSRYRVNQALILRDADGIVFVADSHPLRMDANLSSLRQLRTALTERDTALEDVPHVFQYNKRDLPNRTPLEELDERLDAAGAGFVPAVALDGRGVSQTLKEITRRSVKRALLGVGVPVGGS